MINRLVRLQSVSRHYSNLRSRKSFTEYESKADVRKRFTKSYKKVKSGLNSSLDNYVSNHMDVIKSYNIKHKKSIEDRIKIDLNKQINWEDVITNPIFRVAVLRYLKYNLNDAELNKKISFNPKENNKYDYLLNETEMTNFQKRFYTLMTAYGSTIAKGPNGSGKTFALLSTALNLRRSATRGPGINSLILVKSKEMVLQYERIIKGIVNQFNNSNNIENIAQFLYRGTQNEETLQEDSLMESPFPHVLVATPQRLLDLLSTRGMDYVKINSLAFIGVDDFNTMVDSNFYLESKKKAPIVTLLDYVLKLQDYNRTHNDPHPQMVFTVDEATQDVFVEQVKELTQWFDWNKFAPIGNFKDYGEIPTFKYIPDDVSVSTVLINPIERFETSSIDTELVNKLKSEIVDAENLLKSPGLKKNSKRKLQIKLPMLKSRLQLETNFDLDIHDMEKFEYSQNSDEWNDLLFRLDCDHSYMKHRNQRRNSMNTEMKIGETELLVNGLEKIIKFSACKENLENKRLLVVHEDEISSLSVYKYLSLRFTTEELACLDLNKDFLSFTKPKEDGKPWLYITNISRLKGVTLPGLDRVFVLGLDTLKDTNGLTTVATRLRPANGLIPQEHFSIFPRISECKIRGNVVIVGSAPDFGDLERNFLERSFTLNGLVRQVDLIGETENRTDEDKQRYLSLKGDNSSADSTTFSGMDEELKNTPNIIVG